MGIDYTFYLDGICDGKRFNLAPKIYSIEKNEYVYTPLYYGTSVLGATADKIRELGWYLKDCNTLPRDIYNSIFVFSDDEDEVADAYDEIRNNIYQISLDKMKKYAPEDVYEYHGYASKDTIGEYSRGDIEYIDFIDASELRAMSQEEKCLYEYYEYDDIYSSIFHFKKIVKLADMFINLFEGENYKDVSDARVIMTWC